MTPIQEFFDQQSVFVTGGTGFFGKLLIEKLLRSCPGINYIYVLVRPKRNKNALQRLEELFDDPLFQNLKESHPTFQDKIVVIPGDSELQNLGLSSTDKSVLIQNVNVVFAMAATVKFNENLKRALQINVSGTCDVINLCKQIKNLKACLYVSTAYSNCIHHTIEERFYEHPGDFDELMKLAESKAEKDLLGKWPNSYTFTKALAEKLIRNEAKDLPIGIIRPSIVLSTYNEPIPGWIDNKYGPTGVILGIYLGVLRSLHTNGSLKTNIVPADLAINAIIACVWDVSNSQQISNEIPIYNFADKSSHCLIWDDLAKFTKDYSNQIPTIHVIWYHSLRFVKWRTLHRFYAIFLHFLPGFLMDSIANLTGQKNQTKLFKIYQKFEEAGKALCYFNTKEWNFARDRIESLWMRLQEEDRNIFFFDMDKVDWNTFFRRYFVGIRIHLLKDPMETLPRASKKYKRLYWLHQTLKVILLLGFIVVIWMLT